tara:strand:+ start:651 stop:959 length:309 start_codon:yes stop_codon:yes gene_type:complete
MKRISKFSNSIILILAAITVFLCCYKNSQQKDEFEKLEETNAQLHKDLETALTDVSLLQAELEQVWDENQIFTSMLAEIEGEPGGSEILSNLWDRHHNHEIE